MRKVSTLVGLTLLVLAGTARAQEPAPAGDMAAPPAGDAAGAPAPAPEGAMAPAPAPVAAAGGDYVSAPLTTSAGALKVTLPIVFNLSKSAVLKPVWVPLVLAFGVTDQLEVFLSHTGVGTPIATPGGVCIGGKDRGCEKFYNNVNLGAQFSLMRNNGIELTGIGALEFRRLSDPMHLAIDVGVNFKYAGGPVSVRATPVVGIGVNKRSADGNKEELAVPVQVAFQATPQLALFLDTGIFGPFSHFSDLYAVDAGIGASFAVQPGLEVGGEFLLPAAMAPSAIPSDLKGFNQRYLGVFVTYRTK